MSIGFLAIESESSCSEAALSEHLRDALTILALIVLQPSERAGSCSLGLLTNLHIMFVKEIEHER